MLPLLILAVIQGLTEFLPVSSSGHLVLVHALFHDAQDAWETNLMLDVAVHVGTLFAVLIYFYKDILSMLRFRNIALMLRLIIGSIPVVVAGFILHQIQPDFLRSLEIMAWATILFGVLLWAGDYFQSRQKDMTHMRFLEAFLIGCAQCLALIPGTSRSGITMTAGRALGFSRTDSAHFSLLLSIVAIAGAGVLLGKDVIEAGNTDLNQAVFIAAGISFLTALLSIAAMMKFLARFSFAPFAIYRVLMGTGLLYLIYTGILS